MITQKTYENSENLQHTGSQDKEIQELQEANVKMLPDGAQKNQLESAIYASENKQDQKLFKQYLEKGQHYRLRTDFFTPKGLGKTSPAEDFFKSPNLGQLSKLDAKLKKNEERLSKWEKVTGEKFTGETTNEFIQMVGNYYEGKIMGDTPPPGKNPFSKIDKNANFRWTEGETQKNLQWKKMLVDGNINPTEFFDWLDTKMRPTVEKRDKDIQKWAEESLKKAEKNPKLFSPKYIEYLKNATENIKKTGKNPFPVEIWQNFDELVVKEQKQKRLELEGEIAKDFDENIQLIGVKNVMKWKKGYLKESSLQDLQDWHKSDKPGAKTEFQQEIERLEKQEQEFLKKLDNYPAEANKEEFKEWFYSVNGDEREQCFEFLEKQQGKLEGTQKEAVELLGKKKEFLSEEELTQLHLPNLSKLSNSQQEEKVKEIKRNAEKQQHLVAKLKSRDKDFNEEIAKFEEGSSLKELSEILQPIQEISEEMKKEEGCLAIIDALGTCDMIKAHYEKPENVEMDVQESDILQMFLEDHNISNILLAEAFQQKESANDNRKNVKENLDEAQAGEKKEVYEETVEEFKQEQNPEAANDNRDWETQTALNGDYMKNALHENTSFQEKFNEVQERNADKILSGNDQLSNSVKSTQEKIRFNIEDKTKKNISADIRKKTIKTIQEDPSRAAVVDSSGKEIKDQGTKNKKITQRLSENVKKFFGQKEATKINAHNLNNFRKNAGTDMNKSDSADATNSKLAQNFEKSFGKMKTTVANKDRNKKKKAA